MILIYLQFQTKVSNKSRYHLNTIENLEVPQNTKQLEDQQLISRYKFRHTLSGSEVAI